MASAQPTPQNAGGSYQHFKAAILDSWRSWAAAVLTSRKGFRREEWGTVGL